MLSSIDVETLAPYADARASDLRLALGPTELNRLRPALATRPGPRFLDFTTELRVLGASHQIALIGADWVWTETLAFGASSEPALPSESRTLIAPGLLHDMTIAVKRELSRTQFSHRADEIDRQCRAHDTSLAVRFAGDALAFTAIGASGDAEGLRWETWHLYPESREIMASSTRITIGS